MFSIAAERNGELATRRLRAIHCPQSFVQDVLLCQRARGPDHTQATSIAPRSLQKVIASRDARLIAALATKGAEYLDVVG